jgi:hypothetical protein
VRTLILPASDTDRSRREGEGEHPEIDRAYEREEGGQVPSQDEADSYEGPDPEAEAPGDGADEDQGNYQA